MDWLGKLLGWLEPWQAYLLGLMEGGSLIDLGAAVVAGLLLGLTPVSYLLMPAVVGYAGSSKGPDRRREAALSLAFVGPHHGLRGHRRPLGQHRPAAGGPASLPARRSRRPFRVRHVATAVSAGGNDRGPGRAYGISRT